MINFRYLEFILAFGLLSLKAYGENDSQLKQGLYLGNVAATVIKAGDDELGIKVASPDLGKICWLEVRGIDIGRAELGGDLAFVIANGTREILEIAPGVVKDTDGNKALNKKIWAGIRGDEKKALVLRLDFDDASVPKSFVHFDNRRSPVQHDIHINCEGLEYQDNPDPKYLTVKIPREISRSRRD